KGPMFALKQLLVGAPGRFVEFALLGSGEKIAALQDKRAALAPLDLSPECIFPVGGVQCHFPDIVPARTGAPGRLLCAHTLDGLPEIRSMPGLLFECFLKEGQYQFRRVHRSHLGANSRRGSVPNKNGAPERACQRDSVAVLMPSRPMVKRGCA